jgi:integrase
MRFYILRPSKTHRRFRLNSYKTEDGKRIALSLEPKVKDTLKSINEQYLANAVTAGQAEVLIQDLIDSQYKKHDVQDMVLKSSTISVINQKTFAKFWEDVYEVRIIKDTKALRYDFQKALRLIEPLAINSATQGELQKALQKAVIKTSEFRRAVDRLNHILRYLKRGFKLNKPKKTRTKVSYLTEGELKQVLLMLSKDHQRLALCLFATGMRFGEALAMTPGDFRTDEIWIDKQKLVDGSEPPPKAGKNGTAAVIDIGLKETREWCGVVDKEAYRWTFPKALKRACKEVFPDQPDKWVSPHDLRHSHAIHWLSLGATLSEVALNLRDDIKVAQEYYTGYAHSEGSLAMLKRRLKG